MGIPGRDVRRRVRLPSGNFLFCYNKRYNSGLDHDPSGVMEVSPDKKVVFHFRRLHQPHRQGVVFRRIDAEFEVEFRPGAGGARGQHRRGPGAGGRPEQGPASDLQRWPPARAWSRVTEFRSNGWEPQDLGKIAPEEADEAIFREWRNNPETHWR